MQVKMDENSPRIDGNLQTVRVETARYGFVYGFKSWSPEYEKSEYGSVGVAAVRNGSTQA
jgi:hypothetical protein